MAGRILIVDDDRASADLLARLICSLDYEAKAVYDGDQAIQQTAEFLPDMVLLDIGMPQLDGYEAVTRIRQQRGSVHIILVAVTGWSRDEDKSREYDCGFDLHVTKPMGVETLKDLLKLLDPAAAAVKTDDLLYEAG